MTTHPDYPRGTQASSVPNMPGLWARYDTDRCGVVACVVWSIGIELRWTWGSVRAENSSCYALGENPELWRGLWKPGPTMYESPDAVCPWCDAEQGDTWELKLDDGDHKDTQCDSCSKPIRIECSIEVNYTTYIQEAAD